MTAVVQPPSLSIVQGDRSSPLIEMTIGEYLGEAAQRFGGTDALVVRHQGVRWNYAELNERAEAVAAGLLALGLKPGERVGIWALNCAEWTLTQFATAKAGLVLVSINPAYRTSELEHILRTVECRAIITAERFKTSDYLAMLRELLPELDDSRALPSARLPALRHVITIGNGDHPGCRPFDTLASLADAGARTRLREAAAQVRAGDPVNIQFTSGTTGLPKGATLSHHNLINNGYFVGKATGLVPGSRLCIPVPLYHCFGMVMGNLGCITHGATMVYASESFEPLAVLDAISTERCDALYGVPTMYIALLGHPEFNRFDLSSLRRGIMAGAPCPEEVMREVVERLHMREITIAYGMTETSPISFQSRRDDPIELRVSTVGRVQPHVEVKIVDEEGRVVPRDTPGELLTRGYSVMLGYWADEARTRDAIDDDGWMHTGDLATLDDEGYCRIVGRIKDMVIRGGENIYPREIEEFLHTHSGIQDVQVIGVPDDRYGEELCAWIILHDGAALEVEEVVAFCRGRIAHHKIPRYVRFVEVFPTTITGKVQKYAMRDAMIAERSKAAP